MKKTRLQYSSFIAIVLIFVLTALCWRVFTLLHTHVVRDSDLLEAVVVPPYTLIRRTLVVYSYDSAVQSNTPI